MTSPDFDKPVKKKEAEYVDQLRLDMDEKLKRAERASGKNRDRLLIQYSSAWNAFWREIERLCGTEDHESDDLLQWAEAMSFFEENQIQGHPFFDDDRDDNIWMGE